MTAAAKKVAAQPKKRAPKAEEPKSVNVLDALPKKLAEQKSPYPEDVQTYAYQPKNGGDVILLPLNGFEPPDKVWHFDIAQMSPLSQTWAWMRKANVPKEIQRQCQFLPDAEYFGMFDEWFDVMRKFRGAGPKGAVTAGK